MEIIVTVYFETDRDKDLNLSFGTIHKIYIQGWTGDRRGPRI